MAETRARIEDYLGDPYQLHDVQEKFGEGDHRAPIAEEVKELGEIGTAGVQDSSIADSDLEDGALEKMPTSPLYAQKASGKPDAMVVQEREVSAQLTQARKESFEVSFI